MRLTIRHMATAMIAIGIAGAASLILSVFVVNSAFAETARDSAASQVPVRVSPTNAVEGATVEPVREVHYVNKAKTQAIVITAYYSEWGYQYGGIWFVKGSKCTKLYTADWSIYEGTSKMLNVKGGKVFIVEEGSYGSSSRSCAFFIKNGKAKAIKPFCASLRQLKGNNFVGVKEAYDIIREEDGMLTGHSYKPYYYKWDGKQFVEYGGKAVTKKQLKKAKSGMKIVKAIEKKGKIGKIWYHANGLITVNYTAKKDGHTVYHNVMLRLSDKGRLSYAGKHPYDQGNGGSFKKRGGGTKVSYPKKLPAAIR